MRDVLRQKDQIAGRKDEGPLRRPDDDLTLDQLDNLIVPLMKVTSLETTALWPTWALAMK